MTTHTYRNLLDQVQHMVPHLSMDEQLQFLRDVAEIFRRQNIAEPLHSIMELEGLGEEIWKGIDVDEYLRQERESWDG